MLQVFLCLGVQLIHLPLITHQSKSQNQASNGSHGGVTPQSLHVLNLLGTLQIPLLRTLQISHSETHTSSNSEKFEFHHISCVMSFKFCSPKYWIHSTF